MTNQTVLNLINTNVSYAKEAAENTFRDKVFVVWSPASNQIERFSKTKRGAESYIKKQTSVSYYDEYFQEMVTCGSGLVVAEVSAFDLVDYLNDKKIWYLELKKHRAYPHMTDNVVSTAKYYKVNEEVLNFVIEMAEDMKATNSMKYIAEYEKVQTTEDNKQEEQQVAQTKIIEPVVMEDKSEQNNDTVTVKLNDEMNGIELYFSDIPSVEIRDQLKANGFRWSKRGFWYAKQSEKTLAIANSLNVNGFEATPNTTESIQEPITYPEIDINDLDQYTVSDELQNRLHSASMFQVDYKRDCRVTFEQIQSEALEVLTLTDNKRIQYNVKKYLQSFKKRYYEMYLKMLNHRANNPGWMVTGRGGINIRRYNKKQEQYANMINKATEMMNDFKQRLSKFKDEIGREEQRAFEADLNSVTGNLEGTAEFITETKQIDYMGLKQKVRTYNYNGFTIAKTWGCYRVFKNGKEIDTNLKTTSKLDDAKRFVLYLDHKEKYYK